MPHGTLSLTSYFASALDDAPIAFVASTADPESSRYLKANTAYLQLCGHAWPDIDGKDLVRNGAAIRSAGRDRRLWLLHHHGRYQNEAAFLRHASGQVIPVIMSAHRVFIGDEAVDLEYIFELPIEDVSHLQHIPKQFPILHYPGIDRADFIDSITHSLARMDRELGRNLILTMVGMVLRGIMVLSQMLPSSHPVTRFAQKFGRDLFGEDALYHGDRSKVDGLTRLSREEAEEALLDLATVIWTLARFQKDETRAQLEALVRPYTNPPSALINR